jgi:hypothetical protein
VLPSLGRPDFILIKAEESDWRNPPQTLPSKLGVACETMHVKGQAPAEGIAAAHRKKLAIRS